MPECRLISIFGAVLIMILPWIMFFWLIVHPRTAMDFEARIVAESDLPLRPGDFMYVITGITLLEAAAYFSGLFLYQTQLIWK